MLLIDSHCHLDFFKEEELPLLLERAHQAGVGEVVTIGTRLSKAVQQKQLTTKARSDLKIWCTIGTHPEHVNDEPFMSAKEIADLANTPEIIGIGETGLDYFYAQPEEFKSQRRFFREHIHASQLTQLPLCIHARQADEDMAAILQEESEMGDKFPFLLHCFSSGLTLAQKALSLGGYISFSGIVTFKKSQELRDIAIEIPLDRILVETDSPYLAPVPHRGKTNEPAFVAHTAACLAEIRGMDLSNFINQTSQNFHRLFKKAQIG